MYCFGIKKFLDQFFFTKISATITTTKTKILMGFDTIEINLVYFLFLVLTPPPLWTPV